MPATVLVLTGHPTLTVALTLQGEWDVVSDPFEVAGPAQSSAIVILDSDDTKPFEEQLPAWAAMGRTVVLTSLPEWEPWPGVVLTRPYRLDRLTTVVRDLAAGGIGQHPPAPPAPPAAAPKLFPDTETVEPLSAATEPLESDEPAAGTELAGEDGEEAPIPVGEAELQVADLDALSEPEQAPEAAPEEAAELDHTALEPAEAAPEPEGADELEVVAVEPPVAEVASPPPSPEASPGSTSTSFDDQLRQAIDDARRLGELLARLPSLGSTISLASILADDIATSLAAPTVGIWQAVPDDEHGRYRFLGGVGVTRGESMAPVSVHHPVVADALQSGGTAVENIPSDPARVTGLPASRHPNLVVVPHPSTPFGDLLVIAGLTSQVPERAFDTIDTAVQDLHVPMQVCVQLEKLSQLLHGT